MSVDQEVRYGMCVGCGKLFWSDVRSPISACGRCVMEEGNKLRASTVVLLEELDRKDAIIAVYKEMEGLFKKNLAESKSGYKSIGDSMDTAQTHFRSILYPFLYSGAQEPRDVK